MKNTEDRKSGDKLPLTKCLLFLVPLFNHVIDKIILQVIGKANISSTTKLRRCWRKESKDDIRRQRTKALFLSTSAAGVNFVQLLLFKCFQMGALLTIYSQENWHHCQIIICMNQTHRYKVNRYRYKCETKKFLREFLLRFWLWLELWAL
jgi:hypothetical protein